MLKDSERDGVPGDNLTDTSTCRRFGEISGATADGEGMDVFRNEIVKRNCGETKMNDLDNQFGLLQRAHTMANGISGSPVHRRWTDASTHNTYAYVIVCFPPILPSFPGLKNLMVQQPHVWTKIKFF